MLHRLYLFLSFFCISLFMNSQNTVYAFTLKTLNGTSFNFESLKGKYILLVNVASKCGYTPQYKDLEQLHKQYGTQLAVIGIPANNFGAQEPGSSTEIAEFCKKNYGVSFTMLEKISVSGSDTHPLYQWLCNSKLNGGCSDKPNWNFCKYLIDKNGKVLRFYSSSVNPLSTEITSMLKP